MADDDKDKDRPEYRPATIDGLDEILTRLAVIEQRLTVLEAKDN